MTTLHLYGGDVEPTDAKVHLSLVGSRWYGTLIIHAKHVGPDEDDDETFVLTAFTEIQPDDGDPGDLGAEVARRLTAQWVAWRDEQIQMAAWETA